MPARCCDAARALSWGPSHHTDLMHNRMPLGVARGAGVGHRGGRNDVRLQGAACDPRIQMVISTIVMLTIEDLATNGQSKVLTAKARSKTERMTMLGVDKSRKAEGEVARRGSQR